MSVVIVKLVEIRTFMTTVNTITRGDGRVAALTHPHPIISGLYTVHYCLLQTISRQD